MCKDNADWAVGKKSVVFLARNKGEYKVRKGGEGDVGVVSAPSLGSERS